MLSSNVKESSCKFVYKRAFRVLCSSLLSLTIHASNCFAEPSSPEKTATRKKIWHLYDLYEERDFHLFEKAERPSAQDEENHLLENAAPTVSPVSLTDSIPFVGDQTQATVNRESPLEDTLGFVAQSSQFENFPSAGTRTFWSSQRIARLYFFVPGHYYYRVRTVNKKQELSQWSRTLHFYVVGSYNFKKRKMASVDSTLTTKAPESQITINDRYKSSQISVHAFLWELQSSQQYYANQSASTASGLGVHGIYWNRNHGFEGNLKQGVATISSSNGEQNSLQDFEGRYHYRFVPSFHWSFVRELQVSLFAGYESYHNTNSVFSSKYNLIKSGTSLEFPLASHWSTGGEFVYGFDGKENHKYEISGNLNYFFQKNFSSGVGYRLHLFEAGSPDASPGGFLPYKEGYTEGFMTLNYHF